MSIKLQCQCGKPMKFPDTAAGRRARCLDCGDIFVVPKASWQIEMAKRNLDGLAPGYAG